MMPTDVGAIDLMIGFPSRNARAHYDHLRPRTKDAESKDMEFLAEYMFKEVPNHLPEGEDAIGITLREMDRHNVALGMVCVDDDDLVDRCLLLRRWGRRSEVQLFGSRKGVDRRFFSHLDDGLEYDNLFIFDEVGWNFEPLELSAAFGLAQLRKLPDNLARRTRNFARLCERFGSRPDVFVLPRTTDGLDTAWHMFPVLVWPESGVRRAELQAHMESHGVNTRMVWTGNALRQPAFKGVAHRAPAGGLPNADRVMEQGLILPSNHALDDDDVDYIWETAEAFLR